MSQENLKTAEQLREKLQQLCRRIEVPEIQQHELLAKHNGSQPSTLASLRKEIEQLEELRRQNIEKYVTRARTELEHWWDVCYFSELERQEFLPFYSTDYNEVLLKDHEDEIARLKKYFEEYSELFAKVDKREDLWGQFLEFEKASTDPTRFKSRHYNLITEEKERKRFQALLPKLEKDLFEIVRDLQDSTGRVFTIGGLSFKEHIETQWTAYNEQKELEKKHRQIKKEILTKEEILFGSKPSTPLSLQKTRKRLHDMISTPNSSTRKRAREDIPPFGENNLIHSSMRSNPVSVRDTSKRANPKRRDLQCLFSDMKNLPSTSTVSCKEGTSGLSSYSEFKFSFNAKNLEKLYNRSTPMPSILEGATTIDQENLHSAPIGLENFCTKIFNS